VVVVAVCLQRDVLISAVADDQLKEHGVIAVSFASPKETPVSHCVMSHCTSLLQDLVLNCSLLWPTLLLSTRLALCRIHNAAV
jgi:hypothetical protein